MANRTGTSLHLSDEISSAYQEVRQKGASDDWILFNYADNNNLALLGKGSGGLSGLLGHLKEDERIYGYFKVTWGDDEAKREKFIFLTWVGERVPPLKKARVSTDKAFVKQVVKDFAIEVFANTTDELDEGDIIKKVKLASGADYGSGDKA
eukprot:TRINITY_DN12600_c0_g1_i1.p1 TRINITY_DN12600_c0_g1~~TRINITY_DN12600_c0_g1_i1.p1  ORF type:complete len:158 (-),score=38.59 TRINITY_DN12600_c0_g1_i1:126-578(-)